MLIFTQLLKLRKLYVFYPQGNATSVILGCAAPERYFVLTYTYVYVKPNFTLLNMVAPPASHPLINSILTKPMLQTFHLDPILKVLYEEVGLWAEW